MAIGVVEDLQAVKVDEEYRHRFARLPAPMNVIGEMVEHRSAFEQAGESVVRRLFVQ